MSEQLRHSSSTPDQVPGEPTPSPLQWIKDNSLPITGLLLLGFSFCLVAHYSSITIDWETTHAFIGSIQNLVQVLALCAGGCWAYFKFSKGRTFQQSLTPAVSGRLVALDGVVYLIATIQIKNVGSSRIDFDRESSALVFYEYTTTPDAGVHVVRDQKLTSLSVFTAKDEQYVEPDEEIEVQLFIVIPGPLRLAYRLEAEILSTVGTIWRATKIVDKMSIRDNVAGLIHRRTE